MSKDRIEGLGLGLRFEHFQTILDEKPKIGWFEVIVEDFLNEGPHHKKLERLRQDYPIVFHSVGLNLGGVEEYSRDQLSLYRDLYQRYQPTWISDHLCWSAHEGRFHHDLLPIPWTNESLKHVAGRIEFLQGFFKRELVLENITSYVDFKENSCSEIDFLSDLVSRTGGSLLLDISNVIINHKNRNQDYQPYLRKFPLHKVKQIHLAGGVESDGKIIDSHSRKVSDEDIRALRVIIERGCAGPAMIERDAEIPPFIDMWQEFREVEEAVYGV